VELERLAEKHPRFMVHYFVAPHRVTEESIRTRVSDLQKPIFYLSGPEPMVEAFEQMLAGMAFQMPISGETTSRATTGLECPPRPRKGGASPAERDGARRKAHPRSKPGQGGVSCNREREPDP